MALDYKCLADRWRVYTEVKVCPECGGNHYTIQWRPYWYAGKPGPNYWHYRCANGHCSVVWYDPDRGPSIKEPRQAVNTLSAFESGT